MRRRSAVALFLLALVLFALSYAVSRAAAQVPRTEDHLVQLVRDWLDADARGDHAALDRLIADDFMGFAHGNIVSKDDIAPAGAPPKANVVKYSLQESSVRLYGDTGVVMSRVVIEGAQPPGEFRCTLVFQKRGDAWKMIAAHMARQLAARAETIFTLLREEYKTPVVPGNSLEMPEHYRTGIGGETATLDAVNLPGIGLICFSEIREFIPAEELVPKRGLEPPLP